MSRDDQNQRTALPCLQWLLEDRDSFIVEKGLWNEFVEWVAKRTDPCADVRQTQTAAVSKIMEGLTEALAHARAETSLPVTVRLPDGRTFKIDTERDVEAGIWIATCLDVPGLVITGATWPEMMSKLTLVIPRLIDD